MKLKTLIIIVVAVLVLTTFFLLIYNNKQFIEDVCLEKEIVEYENDTRLIINNKCPFEIEFEVGIKKITKTENGIE